ncbi:hypothetical protein [Holdemania filiformis]|uniref:hypothetical protein n=1 Tax=Holdemania filiformis TaxID=61171 RepID=UPI00242B6327|nr:hypothetical protein [Holdemania filiformis]
MRSKRGSTLLLTICLFMVFLIFAAALIPLSRRAFQQTAADVTQQQADYIAKSAVEALITQLDEESLRQTLIGVVEGSKDQVVSDWASYGDHGEYRYVITLDPLYSEYHDWLAWTKKRVFITAESSYEGKTSKLTAVVQSMMYNDIFFDPDGNENLWKPSEYKIKRAVLINECRLPTEASANFWINAISDVTVTQENVNGQISTEKQDEAETSVIDDKVVLIYRNIKNPTVTGDIDGNILLEPAEYTKAVIGSNQPGTVTINGDIICKGDLVLKNAIVKGAIYYSGTFAAENSSYSGEVYQVNDDNAIFEYYECNLPMLNSTFEAITSTEIYEDSYVEIKPQNNNRIWFQCLNSHLEQVSVKSGKELFVSYFSLKSMPETLIIESENKQYRPIFFIDDENPVLSDQVSTNLLSSENIMLVFTHPVRIQGDVNVSVFAPKIIFEAENITMNGRLQACEFEHSELVSSVNLKARNSQTMYSVPKMSGESHYYFDLYYYQP